MTKSEDDLIPDGIIRALPEEILSVVINGHPVVVTLKKTTLSDDIQLGVKIIFTGTGNEMVKCKNLENALHSTKDQHITNSDLIKEKAAYDSQTTETAQHLVYLETQIAKNSLERHAPDIKGAVDLLAFASEPTTAKILPFPQKAPPKDDPNLAPGPPLLTEIIDFQSRSQIALLNRARNGAVGSNIIPETADIELFKLHELRSLRTMRFSNSNISIETSIANRQSKQYARSQRQDDEPDQSQRRSMSHLRYSQGPNLSRKFKASVVDTDKL
ncbi:hypothetical protein [Acidithrix sp. C25]|uniref:hypothetical protein n=1 Tax=Acidithrix sp. C25 TaxID=1671482 RepID=UPI00191BBE7B|nr:hypothetical protein [Acidithrix sp. C25]CAG4914702.1 unnamed protein product [Acidithrix sp. C25]